MNRLLFSSFLMSVLLFFFASVGAENITAPLIDPAAEEQAETAPIEPLQQIPGLPPAIQPGVQPDEPALFDIKEPIEIVDNTRTNVIIAASILAILLVIALIIYLWKRSRKQKAILAHETALQQLLNAQQLIDDHQVDTFTTLIDQTLRNYIEQRFFIFARRQTTREFIGGLTDGNKPAPEALTANTDNLQTWLEHCDLVKFAKATLSRETMTEMVGNLRSFIESTKIQNKEQ